MMAESLTLQPAGLQFKIPEVDFTASRVQAQAMNELSANLDRMNSFVTQIAEQRAKIEGAEYGTDTAPTQKQIEDAYSSGEEIPIGGDKFSVYGQSVRNAQLSLVHDELEYLARNKMASVIKTYNTNVEKYSTLTNDQKTALSPENLKTEFDEIIAGYASTLDETSPGFARKFRASMNMVSNSNYVSYADKFVKEEMAYNKSVAVASTELVINNMNDTVKAIFGQEKNPKEELNKLIKEEYSKLIAFGGDVVGFNNRFNDAVKTTAKNIVINELLTLPKANLFLPEMHMGNFKDLPKNIGKAMKLAEDYGVNRYDFIKQVKDELAEKKQEKDALIEANKKNNEEKINFAIGDAISFLADNDQDSADDIMAPYINQKLTGTSEELISWEKIRKTFINAKGSDIKDDATTVSKLTKKLYSLSKPLTFDELETELANGKITTSTFTSMATKINSLRKEQFGEARTYVLDMTGHSPDIEITDPNGDLGLKQKIFREIMADVFEAQNEARIAGEPFSAIKTATQLWNTKGVELEAKRIENNRKGAIEVIQNMATQITNYNAELAEQFKNVNDGNLNGLIPKAIETAEYMIAQHKQEFKNFPKIEIQGYPIILSRDMQ